MSLRSRVSPKYFGVLADGMVSPLSVTGGQSPLRSENVVWEDFSALTTMFHRFSHGSRVSSCLWMMADASWGSEAEAKKAVSSAYVATVRFREGVMGRSAVYRV